SRRAGHGSRGPRRDPAVGGGGSPMIGRASAVAPAAGDAATTREPSRLSGTGLTKVYGGRKVVDDVNIDVCQGEIVGLLGPNGAGKTTTFYMLVGLIPPDRGTVTLDGEDLTRPPMYRRARKRVGYLAQAPSTVRKLAAAQNVLAILQ